jgi:hypothetical protein
VNRQESDKKVQHRSVIDQTWLACANAIHTRIYTQVIKELLLESAQLSRKFARKSAMEVERILQILARQSEYTDEENKFSDMI